MTERDIPSLIGWAEKLTGPDREFDCYLHGLAIGGRFHALGDGSYCILERPIDGLWIRGVWSLRRIPRYTGSLDAIVALVEKTLPGWLIQQYDAGVYGADRPTAHLFEPDFAKKSRTEKPYLRGDGSGNSRPLAVCSALLCALQSKGEGNDA